jgi:hypothetical protein
VRAGVSGVEWSGLRPVLTLIQRQCHLSKLSHMYDFRVSFLFGWFMNELKKKQSCVSSGKALEDSEFKPVYHQNKKQNNKKPNNVTGYLIHNFRVSKVFF